MEMLVQLFQVIFRYGTVLEEIAWDNMFLILKEKGDYRASG